MRPSYFADSWFFIALFDAADSHPSRARALERRHAGWSLTTHERVLAELLAFFAADGAPVRRRLVSFTRALLTAREVEVVASSELFGAALDLYEDRADKSFSLVDCMSMVLMKVRGITHVLTNDHHFRQEGFILVNE